MPLFGKMLDVMLLTVVVTVKLAGKPTKLHW